MRKQNSIRDEWWRNKDVKRWKNEKVKGWKNGERTCIPKLYIVASASFHPFTFSFFHPLYSVCIFLPVYFLTFSLFEKLTNLHLLKRWGLTRNAFDRSKQVAICSQIRTYLAFSYYTNIQILTHLEANFTILLPLYNALKPRFSEHKSIGFTSQKLSFCMLKA